MMKTRFKGSTRSGATSHPPCSQLGGVSDVVSPKIRRAVWISSRLIPHVASSVSIGRP